MQVQVVSLRSLVVVAIILIMASVIVDLTVAIHSAKLTTDQILQDLESIQFLSTYTLAGVLRELGFAAGIAWLIGITIERVTREQESKMLKDFLDRAAVESNQKQKEIASDVFRAVIGSFAPPEIRDLVLRTILLLPITRPSARLVFTLRPLNEAPAPLCERYLLLETYFSYDIKNASAIDVVHDLNVFVPKCPIDELQKHHVLKTVAINNVALSDEEIAEGCNNIADTDGETRYRWSRKLEPRSHLRFNSRWVVVKEISDTETWTSLLPTSQLELSVEMQVSGLRWGVDPLHHGSVTPIVAGLKLGMNDFDVREPVLPYQGVHMWWRPIPATGDKLSQKL